MRYFLPVLILIILGMMPISQAMANGYPDPSQIAGNPAPAASSSSTTTQGQNPQLEANTVIKELDKLETNSVFTQAYALAAKMMPTATKMLGLLSVLIITLAGIRFAFTDNPNIIFGELISNILQIGLFSFLLFNYPLFIENLNWLFETLRTVVNANFEVAWQAIVGTSVTAFNEAMSLHFPSIWMHPSLWFNMAMTASISLLSSLAMLFTGLLFVLYWFLSDALAAIAIALGPIFVSVGVWDVTKGFFESWLGFFVSALGYKLIAGVMISLMSQTILSSFTADAGHASPGTAVGSLIMSVAFSYVFMQTPKIASALFGGIAVGEFKIPKMPGPKTPPPA
ncbi:MAG: type IV secretion system protein [Pseudomonadota bacterium]|nr:type IV secretion system protein [Pseudomonadota bacterium]